MAKLTIPVRYRDGVSLISRLDQESAKAIRSTLDDVFSERDENSSLEEAVSNAIARVPKVSKPELRTIIETLLSLYGLKASRETPLERFVEEIREAHESEDSAGRRSSDEDKERFKNNLTTLLSANVFGLAAKVVDLRTEDERLFCHARILTDLRPVFGSQIEDGPQGMIVVHLLKLGYHDASGKHSEFYVALDSDDLEALKRVLNRAEEKSKSLRSYLKDVRLFGLAKE